MSVTNPTFSELVKSFDHLLSFLTPEAVEILNDQLRIDATAAVGEALVIQRQLRVHPVSENIVSRLLNCAELSQDEIEPETRQLLEEAKRYL